jgi:quercetin dioxygenase-like cupin family protein
LVQVILEFAPGAGVPLHHHGGPVVVTVLMGEITLRESGTERTVKAGESWTEQPGAPHAAFNKSSGVLRVAVSVLLPKGAEVTTLLPQ